MNVAGEFYRSFYGKEALQCGTRMSVEEERENECGRKWDPVKSRDFVFGLPFSEIRLERKYGRWEKLLFIPRSASQ